MLTHNTYLEDSKDNSSYHQLLPYFCIYTIAEAHLVLYSHSFLVIVQVQGECRSPWRFWRSCKTLKQSLNLKKWVRVELTSVPTLFVGLMSPFSLHVQPLRGQATALGSSVSIRYSLTDPCFHIPSHRQYGSTKFIIIYSQLYCGLVDKVGIEPTCLP